MTWKEIIDKARSSGKIGVAVACADDSVVLSALKKAKDEGLIEGLLVGNRQKIEAELKTLSIPLTDFEIIEAKNDSEAAAVSVNLVRQNRAKALMKGMISTSTLLKAVLDKEQGLRSGGLLSHILAAEIRMRMFFVTDGGMNLYPDLAQKVKIIENAVDIACRLGIPCPKVAPLCAVETVNPDMRATLDAAQLAKMAERGQIKRCIIDGPLALDNAVSMEAAKHKKISGPVAGLADILLVPQIDAGNILGKSLIYFAHAAVGGIIAGAAAPVILLSRADDDATKFNSICLAKAVMC
ncbi:MAG: bifunctional enoyl-CoA hydratase/phosphate acetyltransferase [Candidatus Wallbacteria bacterium]|nr:bifunctional enoyl-CoA hydratase/phosphate acetyltransferase [Candidatus Wallbacteria bacterium]